jgi:putative membrane protein
VGSSEIAWFVWHGDAVLRANLLFLVGAYLLGVGPIRRRFALAPSIERRHVAPFLSGVLILFVALDGPLHELSDNYLLSAHMVQHMLMTLVAPPLLLSGTPDWLLRPLLRVPAIRFVGSWLTTPLVAFLAFNVPFTLSHFPFFYQATLENHDAHIAEHLIFMFTSILTWWPIFSPLRELPRLSYPLQMMYVFGQTLSGFIVGSFLTNASAPLYRSYAEAPRVFALSALDDQRLGGLIMWVVGNAYLLAIFTAIFFVWANRENVSGDAVSAPDRRRPSAPGHVPHSVGELPGESRLN